MRKFSVVLMLIISLCLIFAIFVSAAPPKEGNTVSGKIQFYESIGTGTSEIIENITFTCGGVEYVSFHYYNEGTPTIELKKADGTYSYPYNGAWGAEEYRVFDFGETEQEISYGFAVLLYKYAEAYVSSITTFDLSTLGLAAGEHIITIKAKADGYKTSEASNAVKYTISSGYTVTFKWDKYMSDVGKCYYSLNGTDYIVMTDGLVLKNVTSIWFRCLSFGDGCNGGECSWTNPVGECSGFDDDTLMYSDAESGEIVLTGNMVVTYGNSWNPC